MVNYFEDMLNSIKDYINLEYPKKLIFYL